MKYNEIGVEFTSVSLPRVNGETEINLTLSCVENGWIIVR